MMILVSAYIFKLKGYVKDIGLILLILSGLLSLSPLNLSDNINKIYFIEIAGSKLKCNSRYTDYFLDFPYSFKNKVTIIGDKFNLNMFEPQQKIISSIVGEISLTNLTNATFILDLTTTNHYEFDYYSWIKNPTNNIRYMTCKEFVLSPHFNNQAFNYILISDKNYSNSNCIKCYSDKIILECNSYISKLINSNLDKKIYLGNNKIILYKNSLGIRL